MILEAMLYRHLSSKLDVPVYLEEPDDGEPVGDGYVVFERTGSSETNFITNATIAVQSYGKSLFMAAELNEKVKQAMDSAVELDAISRSKLNTDYNYTDTTKKKYRYQAVYDLVYYRGD